MTECAEVIENNFGIFRIKRNNSGKSNLYMMISIWRVRKAAEYIHGKNETRKERRKR
jgi:hypothetical protein